MPVWGTKGKPKTSCQMMFPPLSEDVPALFFCFPEWKKGGGRWSGQTHEPPTVPSSTHSFLLSSSFFSIGWEEKQQWRWVGRFAPCLRQEPQVVLMNWPEMGALLAGDALVDESKEEDCLSCN